MVYRAPQHAYYYRVVIADNLLAGRMINQRPENMFHEAFVPHS